MEDSDFEGFSEGSGAGEEDHDAVRENLYYLAKSQRERMPNKAIASLQSLLQDQETSPMKSNWEFKALKQLIKISCIQASSVNELFAKLFSYQNAMPKPYFAKSVVNLIDFVYAHPNQSTSSFFEFIVQNIGSLVADEELRERIVLKGAVKLGRTLIDAKEYERAIGVIEKQLESLGQLEHADVQKATLIIEMKALLLEAYFDCDMFQQVKTIYWEYLQYKSTSLVHPLVVAQMTEFYGKIMLQQGNLKEAVANLFESFKSYDETGNIRKMNVILYFLVAQALLNPEVDPFGSQELAVYKSNQQIHSLVLLIDANRSLKVEKFNDNYLELQDVHKETPLLLHCLGKIKERLLQRVLLNFIKENPQLTEIPLDSLPVQDAQALITKMLVLGVLKGYKLDYNSNVLVQDAAFVW